MIDQWLRHCSNLLLNPDGQIPIGGGKFILRNKSIEFTELGALLSPSFGGYTQSKISSLIRAYTHEESLEVAIQLWDRKKDSRKYHSVGFSCYNHLIKSHATNHLSSVIGPCLQAVVITGHKDSAQMDVYYRTTELFKKFAGDLVLIRNHFIPRFDFSSKPLKSVSMHFSNVTLSPTYFPIPLVQMKDPIKYLTRLQRKNPDFYRGARRWIKIYFDYDRPEYSFNQARRVKKSIQKMVDPQMARTILSHVMEDELNEDL